MPTGACSTVLRNNASTGLTSPAIPNSPVNSELSPATSAALLVFTEALDGSGEGAACVTRYSFVEDSPACVALAARHVTECWVLQHGTPPWTAKQVASAY